MTINLSIPKEFSDLTPRIMVVGVGGAGGNAVNNMVRANLVGCEFIACNTDAQALQHSLADRKVQLGQSVTRGLGAGARPDVGRQAAEEATEEILGHLNGSNMVFITAGMGGGTGTGAAPVIAKMARENGILTVGVVTKPFQFEGTNRMRLAEAGIEELQKFVDTLLIIPNQNLFRVANERTTFAEAFKMADDVLYAGVRGVTDLMVMPGLINLDFADIRAVMSEMGKAMMGTGEAAGEKRAIDAAEAAISNPLLDDVSMRGAKGVLINITGGSDMTLFEVDEAANRIREEVDPEANIIFGSTFDEKLEGKMRISVVATGIDAEVSNAARAAAAAQAAAQQRAAALTPLAATVEAQPEPVMARLDEPASIAALTRKAATAVHTMGELPVQTAQRAPAAPVEQRFADPRVAEQRPAAEVAGDAFLAPRPMQPMVSRNEADMPLGALRATQPQPAPKPRQAAPSLFQRIIGRGHAEPPRAAQPAPRPQPQQQPQAAPRLGAIDPAERAPQSSEEDYLDIPAFLRRQAN
ncbi:cell division protein FtsZ [Aliidongia dinghuensis]|uniref:Cell division protein FtsZ n=1 Tax=Aliidongia dinghuensis TaxID=1867774 RepID=A0A8J2YTF7_9PROT|nr:cell division protein FtsZ [Aliidongia dinghuensis]GGF17414.1 cell division protein FtsZ [Aliidongia dinghuensis]